MCTVKLLPLVQLVDWVLWELNGPSVAQGKVQHRISVPATETETSLAFES
jgi:hypothetical protein